MIGCDGDPILHVKTWLVAFIFDDMNHVILHSFQNKLVEENIVHPDCWKKPIKKFMEAYVSIGILHCILLRYHPIYFEFIVPSGVWNWGNAPSSYHFPLFIHCVHCPSRPVHTLVYCWCRPPHFDISSSLPSIVCTILDTQN